MLPLAASAAADHALLLSPPHRLLLPALKSLLLDHPKLTLLDPQQLSACGALTHLTQLHLGGPACFHLRCQHLKWVGGLTRLQDLKLRGCTKVWCVWCVSGGVGVVRLCVSQRM